MPHKPKSVLLAGVQGVVKSKKIGCNTLALEYDNGNKAIRYHNTDVITTFPNGDKTLTSGGWRTVTTKKRFNDEGFRVYTDKGIWYVTEPATSKVIPFFDGMTFDAAGFVKGANFIIDFQKIKAVKKRIAKFVKLVDSLNTIPMPNGGDCWYCLMKTQEGKPAFNDTDHLESHLDEGYLHGSLIFNALKEKGYREPALIMRMNCKTSIKAALRRYLTRRLLPDLQAA